MKSLQKYNDIPSIQNISDITETEYRIFNKGAHEHNLCIPMAFLYLRIIHAYTRAYVPAKDMLRAYKYFIIKVGKRYIIRTINNEMKFKSFRAIYTYLDETNFKIKILTRAHK